MCHHYTLKTKTQLMREAFSIGRVLFTPHGDVIDAEYRPSATVPVIRQGSDPGSRELVPATWGIEMSVGRVMNSRDDRAHTTWRRFVERRVVFPVSRAVEPKYKVTRGLFGAPVVDGSASEPWALFPKDGSVAAVAGIAGPGMATVSMFTTAANKEYAEVHNKNPDDPRMVAFLMGPDEVDAWLDVDRSFGDVRGLLRPAPEGYLRSEKF